MKIKTRNSVYEVDEGSKQIRRLFGTRTRSLPVDEEWYPYVSLEFISDGFYCKMDCDGGGIFSSTVFQVSHDGS